ncbi:MAG TPA: DMT family transporter [Planctomycetota bacterium]|nr:DMT family transporter [Planctomycetota bacterium]
MAADGARWSLLIGVLALSTFGVALSGPLLKIRSDALDPIAVAFWRMGLSCLLTSTIWLLGRLGRPRDKASPPLDRRAIWPPVVGGFFLALHFATWISSLDRISVAASVVIVNSLPIFAALLSWVWLRESLSRVQRAGLVLAVAGVAMIAILNEGESNGADGSPTRDPIGGALLALAGAASGAVYFVIGRFARRGGTLFGYVSAVYGASAAFLLLFAIVLGSSIWPFPPRDWLVLAGLVIGPTLLGHTVLNWALKWVPAPVANSVTLGEPLVAALLAFLFVREVPPVATVVGGIVLLAGIALVVRGRAR